MKDEIVKIATEIFPRIKFRSPHKWNWILYGIFYGYPECCIIAFCEEREKKSRHPLQSQISNSTGFIPCKRCTAKIVLENLKLQDLIQDRFCQEPFISYEKM